MNQLDFWDTREIIVDSFAGGGGVSTGIEAATGRPVDIAINHDPAAIAMHKVNHPHTEHYCESVWEVDPRKATRGRPVGLFWLSPDCKHFSKAKGGKPVSKDIRGLAWIALRWAATVKPRVIMLENVEEFKDWGPLLENGMPDPNQKGRTFQTFVNALKRQGYQVEYRELKACDYGAPTKRKRFVLIARCDGRPIIWPEPTHGDPERPEVKSGKLKPLRMTAEIIDWAMPVKSIFERDRPLAENTMIRLARGIQRFVIDNPRPFIAPLTGPINNHGHLVSAFLTQYHSYAGDGARGQTLDRPILTLDTANRYALVTSHLIKFRGTNIGQPMDQPLQTITAGGLHFGEVRAFLIKYYGADVGQNLDTPLHTITTKGRFALVTVAGQDYQIVDIGMRMLEPRELFDGQGFPVDYIIDRDAEGRQLPKAEQVKMCGNSVPPVLPKHLVWANLPELCRDLRVASGQGRR